VSLKLDTHQQNALTQKAIESCADAFAQNMTRFSWMRKVLVEHGLNPVAGMLVSVTQTTGQVGDDWNCLWLTNQEKFWSVDAIVSRDTAVLMELESVEQVTDQIETNAHAKGIGKSFGRIALDVLHARMQPSNPTNTQQ
jgi:hypothetical protein